MSLSCCFCCPNRVLNNELRVPLLAPEAPDEFTRVTFIPSDILLETGRFLRLEDLRGLRQASKAYIPLCAIIWGRFSASEKLLHSVSQRHYDIIMQADRQGALVVDPAIANEVYIATPAGRKTIHFLTNSISVRSLKHNLVAKLNDPKITLGNMQISGAGRGILKDHVLCMLGVRGCDLPEEDRFDLLDCHTLHFQEVRG